MPIVPDEARTFGMEALFRQVGIYSHAGQLYEPVDMDTLLYYKEASDGQILEEGITEAGSMSSFIAAGTAYATHGVNTIPFFIYYSMFGFQRIGDLIWAAGRHAHARVPARRHRRPHDARRRRAAAPGRQQPPVRAGRYPNCVAYDPAFAYEIAVIIEDGIRRMYVDQREHLLLPDGDERAVRDAGDARGRARRHPQGAVPLPRGVEAEGASVPRAAVRQRRDPARSDQGAGDPRVEVRRRRRRVERHELQRAVSRGARVRAVEHAAPGRDAARAVRRRSA